MIDIIKKIMYAYDDLPELVQAFIFISLVIFFGRLYCRMIILWQKNPTKRYKKSINRQLSLGVWYAENTTECIQNHVFIT